MVRKRLSQLSKVRRMYDKSRATVKTEASPKFTIGAVLIEDVDPAHADVLARARGGNSDAFDVDVAFMASALDRLSLWESGVLAVALRQSIAADVPTVEQRALLALFVYRGEQ